MNNKSFFPQKTSKILLRFSLLIVLFSLASGFVECQEIRNLPESYGYYFFNEGKWKKIPELIATLEAPLKERGCPWGIYGLDYKPEIAVKSKRPVIYIYEQDIDLRQIKLVRLWYFQKLRAVDYHGDPPPHDSFEKSLGVSANNKLDFGKWTVAATYPIKGGPIPNQSEMYLCRPNEELLPGKYAVCPGTKFTSHPSKIDSGLSVRVFEIIGEEENPALFNPVDNPPVKIINCSISDTELGTKTIKRTRSEFLVSVKQIICSIDVKGQRGGEIVEFIWCRPDGTIQAKYKQGLPFAQPGRLFHVYHVYKPNHLLMPGKWTVAIKIYGQLVKCHPFYVSVD
jgi:hypothetical protein